MDRRYISIDSDTIAIDHLCKPLPKNKLSASFRQKRTDDSIRDEEIQHEEKATAFEHSQCERNTRIMGLL